MESTLNYRELLDRLLVIVSGHITRCFEDSSLPEVTRKRIIDRYDAFIINDRYSKSRSDIQNQLRFITSNWPIVEVIF
jgi:hypothetical protein